MNYNKPEILAPVGSLEAFYSAIAAGCDAVYLGGKSFGARAYADNFTFDHFNELIDYAHLYDVKIYYTINTLVKDIEIKELKATLDKLSKLPIDAFIIQDLGVYQLIKSNYPHFIIHSSTQMNFHSIEDIIVAKKLGFDRVILSRECSLNDIKLIKKEVDIELETFVHGALCYSYSGQCLMSSMYGGRSGNRGKCAQPCRLPYDIDNEKAYFLSLKDQMTLNFMPDFIKAGIVSFKIEGRMKGPEYVYLATKLYKKYRDLSYELIISDSEDEYKVDSKDLEQLTQLFNRGNFTEGYYYRHNANEMISYNHSKNLGIKVGLLTYNKGIKLSFNYEIDKNDLLEIHIPNTLETITFKINKDVSNTINVQNLYAPDQKIINMMFLKKGQKLDIYRIRDTKLLNNIGGFSKRQSPLHVKVIAKLDEPLSLVAVLNREIEVTVLGDFVQAATNRPVEIKDFKKQLKKTKDTNFYFDKIDFYIDDNIFVPIGAINKLRRNLIDKVNEQLISNYKPVGNSLSSVGKNIVTKSINNIDKQLDTTRNLSILVRTPSQFHTSINFIATNDTDINCVYIDITDITGDELNKILIDARKILDNKSFIKICLALPHVSFIEYNEILINKLNNIDIMLYDGFLVRTLGQILFLKNFNKEIITDYNIHAFNTMSVKALTDIGASKVSLSQELNKQGIYDIKKECIDSVEMVVYGATALMHFANCLYQTRYGKCKKTKEGHNLILKDRKNINQQVFCHCDFCYNSIYNHLPLYLLDDIDESGNYRVDFINETANDIINILNQLTNKKTAIFDSNRYTRGHYKRGVL